MGARISTAIVFAIMMLTAPARGGSGDAVPSIFDRDAALDYSQSAIGRSLPDYTFVDTETKTRRLSDYSGKPLVVNMVYTGCIYSCPLVVQALYDAVDVAEEALGGDRFNVITVGFDTDTDTPAQMRAYARSRGIALDNWEFLSTDAETAARLAGDLGFLIMESPGGFEHIAQTTIVDGTGRIYQHVYGAEFEPPALVEPLKNALLAVPGSAPPLAAIIERVRLFCTNYDPASGRYAFDYGIFVGLIIGGIILIGLLVILVRSARRAFRNPPPVPKEQV
jgi:protein SCO1/2